MAEKNYLKILRVDQKILTPIYKQLANGIIEGIETGRIVKDDILPSLHDLSSAFDISKSTVEQAYRTVKNKGLIDSVPGKGYLVVAKRRNQLTV